MENVELLDKKTDTDLDESCIFNYAFCGNKDQFANRIKKLAELAAPETWSSENNDELDILYYYILDTFKQCYRTKKIIEEGSFACFNTGLMTANDEDIYGLFSTNSKEDAQEWFLIGFFPESDWTILNNISSNPELAKYTSDNSKFYFDTDKNIIWNIDHILDENWERYDQELKDLGKETVSLILTGAYKKAIKRIKRNNRLVVPQFYKGKIMYLLPLELKIKGNTVTMALAVEELNNGKYRANTIFTTKMAYGKARLLMKPESNWLLK